MGKGRLFFLCGVCTVDVCCRVQRPKTPPCFLQLTSPELVGPTWWPLLGCPMCHCQRTVGSWAHDSCPLAGTSGLVLMGIASRCSSVQVSACVTFAIFPPTVLPKVLCGPPELHEHKEALFASSLPRVRDESHRGVALSTRLFIK